MPPLSVPLNARLSSSVRVDSSNPAIIKSLTRLSRDALISLALDWLDDDAIKNAAPYIVPLDPEEDEEEDEDDIYPPCRSVAELRQLYTNLQSQKGSKRDVVSRILEGDWRYGLSLYQLAMADFAYLDEHPTTQKWSAYQILPLEQPSHDADGDENMLKVDNESLKIPRFHPSTFLQNLQAHVLPDVKAHYHFYRPQTIPVLLLRIFVIDSPYNTELALSHDDNGGAAANFDSSRVVYLAFPDGSPSLYISKSQSVGPSGAGESKSLQNLIVRGVPKALSRPLERFTLKYATFTSRNLDALLDKSGPGRGNSAGGGWTIYADEKDKKSPLDSVLPTPPLSDVSEPGQYKRPAPLSQAQRERKRIKVSAKARFGTSAIVTDGKGVERVEIVVQDSFPGDDIVGEEEEEEESSSARQKGKGRNSRVNAILQEVDEEAGGQKSQSSRWTPTIKLTFHGPHVFAGIRQLVEAGIVDGMRMPGWMTGEEGVTTGVVRDGRIRGHKGSGV